MSMKSWNVRFWGLMTVLIMLITVSGISCKTNKKKGPGPEPITKVSGACRKDVDGDGYEATEPPIAGAYMFLNGSTDYTVNRQSTGVYSFLGISPGDYTLTASAVGYATQTTQTFHINLGESKTFNFGMIPYP